MRQPRTKKPAGSDLYVIQQHTTGAVKIGRTGNIKRRLRELLTGSPYRLKCILLLEGQGYLERRMHQALRGFESRTSKGEWFDYEGLPSLPNWIYEQLDIEDMDTWWVSP